MKKILTLLLLGGISLSCTPRNEQMNVVIIEFEGKRFDNLSLFLSLQDFYSRELISGRSEDGYRWEFHYPDSLYDYISFFQIRDTNVPDTVISRILFYLDLQGDTLRTAGLFFDRPSSLVRARYIGAETHLNVLMLRRGTEDGVLGTVINHRFEIISNVDDQQLISAMKTMTHGYGFRDRLTAEEMLQRDMGFVKRFPNSRAMISLVASGWNLYGTIDNTEKLFNLFTPELQQSFYGRRLNERIRIERERGTAFINQKLTTWDTDELEWIVQDSSRYNLILFSASWCAPCTRQIPLLKEIYRDLGQQIIMTYVSLDDERTVDNWRTKMREHQIPWRSLMVLTREMDRTIREYYAVRGIPTAILVHPHTMQKERLNLWEEADRQLLYELVK